MERINVAVRARPLSPEDAKTSPWQISTNSILLANPPTKFDFDRIFRDDCKTVDVYESRTKDIVSAAVGGFNGTVFAYGQTNSGKTHTMRGSNDEPGVIPLAVHDLFNMIQKEMEREFLLRMSYMEIYNEEINDLLAPEHRKLQIHESIERGIFVAGLKEEIVTSPQQVLEFMEFGEAHRHIGETNMNVHSSRSHTIFRMIIESRDKCEDEYAESSCDAVRVSVLNLVDLAGSERAAKTGAEGVRLKEGSHINKSLMTLGTVIKKLSEGAESQGGHVPYRDSKLTRILQPALGGNANTAIICNITLAQVHADETKSSLQFASRALRVTNCVHVNEILTDAALLKRQKKEIEELRAKLQGSHSDNLGNEILNLRNTLLQSELERERIALELEEEKKAQAEREKMLLEQSKKIQNLSSMVLSINRDETYNQPKKAKRRDTWCPGELSKVTNELPTMIPGQASAMKPVRVDRERGPLLPFDALVNDNTSNTCNQERDRNNVTSRDFGLPDSRSLIHVTSRKKPPIKKKNLHTESAELTEMRTDYENLLLQFETERMMSFIQIDYLTRRLMESNTSDGDEAAVRLTNVKCPNETEADIVVKQLQEKISILEIEKSSSMQNLESAVELETEKNAYACNKQEELHIELLAAQEEARLAHEKLTSMEENNKVLMKLFEDIQDITSDVQHSKAVVDSMMQEHLQSCSAFSDIIADVKSFSSCNNIQIKTLLGDYEKIHCSMKAKVDALEHDKIFMNNHLEDLQQRIEQERLNGENSAQALRELSETHEMETTEFLSHIKTLEHELSSLSSLVSAKEKESMRKDLEKTKAKLKETEFKLRNMSQEKTKLEGEKACAEREIKRLHGQKAILERDINKRESIAGRRRDSVMDRSSNIYNPKKVKGHAVSVDQEEFNKLEVLAFEMEATIGSLEEQLAIVNDEKEQAVLRAESLDLKVQELSDKLNFTNSELQTLEELVSSLRAELENAAQHNQNADSSITRLAEEKDELAMQLTDALLTNEEERAIWSAKEKASIESIENKTKLFNDEIASLTDSMSKARIELDACRQECQLITSKLALAEEKLEMENTCSMERSIEIDQLKNDLRLLDDQKRISEDVLMSKLETLSLKYRNACEEVDKLLNGKNEVEELKTKLSTLEVKIHNDNVKNSLERPKLRMRLNGAQTKLDSIRVRCEEEIEEKAYMHKQYEEATNNLKSKYAARGIEIMNLKKQLALKG
ncbi:kinesin-like protein KIN-7O [Rutidosis leptorrhynchoides]|uniref:kinesin-like protein KIN-7O n=1 Tax=Rutidosis leptorrhynchoides TaxID=125765 RepID=UPI003A9A3227